jgi:hypothetical protein
MREKEASQQRAPMDIPKYCGCINSERESGRERFHGPKPKV